MSTMAGSGKILIMAGGTGGHVFPALCLARYLSQRGVAVEWLGTRAGLEATVIPRAGFPIHYISVSGLRGKSLSRKLLGPLVVARAVLQSLARLRAVKPACVLGMGGFVTGPGGIAAWLLRKPLLIHEQNAIAGFTNQLLLPFSTVVMEAFPGAFAEKKRLTGKPLLGALLRGKVPQVTGNPVRAEITAVKPPGQRLDPAAPRLKLLVIGGSLGAVAINRVVPAALADMDAGTRPLVLHQCGARNLEQARDMYREQGLAPDHESLRVEAFIDDMAQAYAWADLVLCRSGALTVSELANVGVASILVPYPHAVDDHQSANARYLSDAGAAVLVPQEELDAALLRGLLESFMARRGPLLDMAEAARAKARPRAVELVAERCLEACHG